MPSHAGPKQNTITTITDSQGKVIVRIKQDEYIIIGNDGNPTSYTRYRNIQLVDGSTWNPAMLWAKPPIYIGVCSICREPSRRRRHPTHGLVAMARAKLCTCGILCCPKHRKLCSDNKWRCPACVRKYHIKTFLRPMFFSRVEE